MNGTFLNAVLKKNGNKQRPILVLWIHGKSRGRSRTPSIDGPGLSFLISVNPPCGPSTELPTGKWITRSGADRPWGLFNQWVKGSFFEDPEKRETATVAMEPADRRLCRHTMPVAEEPGNFPAGKCRPFFTPWQSRYQPGPWDGGVRTGKKNPDPIPNDGQIPGTFLI